MHCPKCNTENSSQSHSCNSCSAPLYIAVLKEIGKNDAVTMHYVFEGGARVGRHYDNSIVLLDYSVSRNHARIDYLKGKFVIQDLSSSNGVLVNDVRVRRKEINDFDRIMLGNVLLLFRTSGFKEIKDEPFFYTQERFIEAIQDISKSKESETPLSKTLEIAANFALSLTGAERGIILLYDSNGELQPAFCGNISEQTFGMDEFDISRSAMEEAEKSGEMLIQESIQDQHKFKASQSIRALKLTAIICLPLKSPRIVNMATQRAKNVHEKSLQGTMFGVLYLDSRQALKGLPQHRRDMLQILADQTSLAIENAILQEELVENEDMKGQIQAAKEVQQRLFPQREFSHPRFEMAYQFQAAQHVGGDYLGFIPLSESRFLLAIGDVVGKGLPAGLVVMTLYGGLYSEISHQQDIRKIIDSLDRLIYDYTAGKVFVTFFLAILDLEANELEFMNAGHNPPLLRNRHNETWQELRAGGVPLGVDPSTKRVVQKCSLDKDDIILFYTDGLVEAHDTKNQLFGMPRLKQAITNWLVSKEQEELNGKELTQVLFKKLRYYTNNRPLDDDTTMMTVIMK